MPVVKAFLGDPTPPAKLPFCQSTVAAFLNKHSPCLRPIVVPHCQYICHLIASLPPSQKTHRAFFNLNQVAVHANTYGIYPSEITALQKDYADLWEPLSELLKKLSAVVSM